MNFVVNRDRGEIIDINNGKVIETFGKSVLGEVSKSSQAILNEGSLEHNTPSNAINSSVVHSMPIIRNKVSFEDVDEKSDNVWDDYWNQSEKVHKKLLESICQKNNKVLSELFNKKLNHMPINVNYKSFDNWTPIHYAAQHGNTYAIELLLGIP
jgi:ankyrin repeat protein